MQKLISSETDWSPPITLTEAETWQVRAGAVLLTFGSAEPGSDSEGHELLTRDVIRIEAGEVVRHRRSDGSAALISREARL